MAGTVPAGDSGAIPTDLVKLDLNCDLGEGEPLSRTRALMRWVSSANVACGGHAGDARSMAACVRMAKHFGVRLGAHPGPLDRDTGGRGPVEIEPEELELLLIFQISALEKLARAERVALHHIKLHGALYSAVEHNRALARSYVRLVRDYWPGVRIYARAGGQVALVARRHGVVVWEEAFLDRGYLDDGTLVPRTAAHALVTETVALRDRLLRLIRDGRVLAMSGKPIPLQPRTLCIHSDTPGAVALARVAAQWLSQEGFNRQTGR